MVNTFFFAGCVALLTLVWKMSSTDFAELTARQLAPAWTMSPDEILAAAHRLVAADVAMNDKIAAIENPTIENVLWPTIKHSNESPFEEDQATFLQYVSDDQAVRDASTEAERIIDQNAIEQGSREDLYKVYSTLWESVKDKTDALDPESRKFLEKTVLHFKRNGLNLPQETRDKVKDLKIELSKLSTAFAKNTNEEKGSIEFTKEQLDGIPELVMEQYEQSGDKYKVTFKYPDILPLMKYAKNQETRKAAYAANTNKVPENDEILDKIIRIRFQIAKLMGYKNYSEFVLEERMAKTPEKVLDFLGDLRQRLRPLAENELQKMLEFKNDDLKLRGLPAQEKLYAWDHAFYNNLLLEKEYAVDHEKISEYFPIDQTIEKMLGLYEHLFDVKFQTVENPDPSLVWHKDVRMIAVYQNIKHGSPKNEFMGWIMFDLHPREGKYTHAAQFGLQSAYEKADGTRSPFYGALVCNFSKPSKTKPSLLRHNELTTFFHELGHGVHSLLSRTKHAMFQGTRVPRDFVECPSQMLEFWTWSKNELRTLSGHYETGEPIPDDLIDQLIKSKHVNTGLANSRQLFFGIFDMDLHTIADELALDKLDLKSHWNLLREDVTLLSSDGLTSIDYCTFGHIAGGYESGYYGYLWLQVFATDIYYTHFKSDPLNVESGLKYRDIILRSGNLREISDILEELLGRPASLDAFFEEILGN